MPYLLAIPACCFRAVYGNRTRLAGLGSRSPTNGRRPHQGKSVLCRELLTLQPFLERSNSPLARLVLLLLRLSTSAGDRTQSLRLKGECSTLELRKRECVQNLSPRLLRCCSMIIISFHWYIGGPSRLASSEPSRRPKPRQKVPALWALRESNPLQSLKRRVLYLRAKDPDGAKHDLTSSVMAPLSLRFSFQRPPTVSAVRFSNGRGRNRTCRYPEGGLIYSQVGHHWPRLVHVMLCPYSRAASGNRTHLTRLATWDSTNER